MYTIMLQYIMLYHIVLDVDSATLCPGVDDQLKALTGNVQTWLE